MLARRRSTRPASSGRAGSFSRPCARSCFSLRRVTRRESQPLSPTQPTDHSLSARSRRSASAFRLVRRRTIGHPRVWSACVTSFPATDERSRRPTARAARRLPGLAAPLRRDEARSSVAPQRPLHDPARAGRGLRPRNEQRRVRRPRLPRRRSQPCRTSHHARRKHGARISRSPTSAPTPFLERARMTSSSSTASCITSTTIAVVVASRRSPRYVSDDGHIHVIDLELPEQRGLPRVLGARGSRRLPAEPAAWRALLTRALRRSRLRALSRSGPRADVVEHGLLQREAEGRWLSPGSRSRSPSTNEEEVFPELVRRLAAVLDDMPGGPHEIVFVDDGSTDRTFNLIVEAAASDPRVVGVRLSRNFGHQAALTAALETVTGDVVIAMDGDLQDRPEEIPRFVAEYEKGYDVVYAQRVRRKESLPFRAVVLPLLPLDETPLGGEGPGRLGRLRAPLATRRRPDQPASRASPLHPRTSVVGRLPADGNPGRARRPRPEASRATR